MPKDGKGSGDGRVRAGGSNTLPCKTAVGISGIVPSSPGTREQQPCAVQCSYVLMLGREAGVQLLQFAKAFFTSDDKKMLLPIVTCHPVGYNIKEE